MFQVVITKIYLLSSAERRNRPIELENLIRPLTPKLKKSLNSALNTTQKGKKCSESFIKKALKVNTAFNKNKIKRVDI